MGNTITVSWTDRRGHVQSREVNQVADARDFQGTAGYPWVIMAANPGLSTTEIARFLAKTDGAERSLSWIKRHRWMFPPHGTTRRRTGPMPNTDGKQARAIEIMQANPSASARQLSRILKDNGINRGRDWVLHHRCDPVSDRYLAHIKNKEQQTPPNHPSDSL